MHLESLFTVCKFITQADVMSYLEANTHLQTSFKLSFHLPPFCLLFFPLHREVNWTPFYITDVWGVGSPLIHSSLSLKALSGQMEFPLGSSEETQSVFRDLIVFQQLGGKKLLLIRKKMLIDIIAAAFAAFFAFYCCLLLFSLLDNL